MERLSTATLENRERPSASLTYHHARPLSTCSFSRVYQESPLRYMEDQALAECFDGAFHWAEREIGFYPLFVAVGRTEEDLRMTGYQNQWRRPATEVGQDNYALFSFRDFPGGVFMDFHNWHYVLNNFDGKYHISGRAKQMIFRPSWIKNDWITYANKNPHSVQLLVPNLDLTQASRVSVRNQQSRDYLINLGFSNVHVERLTVQQYSTA